MTATLKKSRARKNMAQGTVSLSYPGNGKYTISIWDGERYFTMSFDKHDSDRIRDWFNQERTF